MEAQAPQADEGWQDTQAAQPGGDPVREKREAVRPAPTGAVRSPRPFVLVLVAVLVLAIIAVTASAYSQRRSRLAAAEIVRMNAETARQAQLQAEQQLRDETARQQARQAEQDKQDALKRQAIREREQQEEAARKAVAAEEVRKEQAWQKFYRKPSSCNDSGSIECANGYIKARRTFEQKYGRGEL